MKLQELLPVLESSPVLTGGAAGDIDVTGLRYDSRAVRQGDVFFAWKGDKVDGHQFIPEARDRGASAVVLEDGSLARKDGLTYVTVPNARRALARMAAAFHGFPSRDLQMIGITGTNGKTTTAFLLKSLLEKAGRTVGLIGTVRYEIGARITPSSRTTPEGSDLQELLAKMKAAGCDSTVMEVSSHALVQGRVSGIDYQIGIFTNLTPDHLDYHGTMEEYFSAKLTLFLGLGRPVNPGIAVLNLDDAHTREIQARLPAEVRVVTYSATNKPGADCAASDAQCDIHGTRFTLRYGNEQRPVSMPLLGEFNVANALAASSAALLQGVSLDQVAEGLAKVPGVPGRLERVRSSGFAVVVDYAHTEDAVRKILGTLRLLKPRRLLVVIGCGGNRDRTKRPRMAQAAVELADLSIFTADNPRNESPEAILDEMEAGLTDHSKFIRCTDRREAIAQALALAGEGDLVCIAGKGHETTQEINGIFHPFDDRQVAADILAGRGA